MYAETVYSHRRDIIPPAVYEGGGGGTARFINKVVATVTEKCLTDFRYVWKNKNEKQKQKKKNPYKKRAR